MLSLLYHDVREQFAVILIFLDELVCFLPVAVFDSCCEPTALVEPSAASDWLMWARHILRHELINDLARVLVLC